MSSEGISDTMRRPPPQRQEAEHAGPNISTPTGSGTSSARLTIKQWMNQGVFLMRGLEKVRAEFSLTALAYNLRRVLNIVAFADLIATLQA